MPQMAKVSIKISREKLKKGDYSPDSERIIKVYEVSEEELEIYRKAAAEFLWHQMKGSQLTN